jgi:hypothetical protein
MTRRLLAPVPALAVLLAACHEGGSLPPAAEAPIPDDAFLAWTTGSDALGAQGFALPDDGRVGVTGIGFNTCTVELDTAATHYDTDAGEGFDTVIDAVTIDGVSTVLVSLDDDVGLGLVDLWADNPTSWFPEDVVIHGSALTPSGKVVVRMADADGCHVAWTDTLGGRFSASVGVPDVYCRAESTMAATDALAFVPGPGGLALVGRDGDVQITAVPGNRALWDGANGLAYVAEHFGTALTAVDARGHVVWTRDAAGPIGGFDAFDGDLLVSEAKDDASTLVLHDGATGESLADVDVAAPTGSVVSTDDGLTVALVGRIGWDVFTPAAP